VLEGSVRKAGERVRITAQLVSVADGYGLWSETYDRDLKDVFTIHDEISRAIVNALRVQCVSQKDTQFLKPYTENLEAHNLYFKGCYYQDRWTREWTREGSLLRSTGLTLAIEYFRQAIAEDGKYALPYAGLAESYSLVGFHGLLPPKEVMPAAKAAAMKALEIDKMLAAAHTSLGVIRSVYDWDWSGAEQAFKCALAIEPLNANSHYWYAHYLASMGRLDAATAEISRAHELDPLSLVINMNSAITLYLKGQYSEAIEQSQRTIEMDSEFAGGYWSLGLAFEQQSNYEEAIQAFQKAAVLSGAAPWVMGSLGHCYALWGKTDKAAQALEGLKERSKRRYVSPITLAQIHIGLGEKDQAFQWLEQAHTQRDGRLIYLKVSPVYDAIRSDSRFLDLVRRVGLSS